jgi:hypothetical protein
MDDSVVGYLAGCMNTAAMTPSTDELMQDGIRKHLLLFRPDTAGLLYRGMLDTIRDRERAATLSTALASAGGSGNSSERRL